ncbi:MAG TPA: hypothetical protein DCK95_08725 [Anaerolineaceae bacterium]|uniref:Probable 2-phosphosulfolactate phosphatase n=1 Tax=Anaerolinea thermophila TaxID=167964 RepID=A0A124FMV5_9CHLR|nr:MAG: 2-phosphosulfolactate phosphatase family protein [Anaerolinea thermophila]HAF62397.1 hypothetical protein [Anaerolineaceae bacterium]
MEIERATLDDCHLVKGMVVVIDVLRAYTTAACLFDRGARGIILVSKVEEALCLREEHPEFLIVGEVNGIRVDGFDLGNSPSEVNGRDFTGKTIIQRTTAGTQGVVGAKRANIILAAALTNISATVHYIQNIKPKSITLLQTGLFPHEGWGDEDIACADCIEAKLLGNQVDWEEINKRVRSSRSGLRYDGTHAAFSPSDLEIALQHDKFKFAMVVKRNEGLHYLQKEEMDEYP